MKITTKLLLSILPISSISLLSVVSCSTTSPNAKQPGKTPKIPEVEPKTPDDKAPGKTPKTPPKPDESKQPDNNNNNSTTPNENNNPSKPEKPNVKPHNDQPNDQPHINKDEFSDLSKLDREISFKDFQFYTSKDATTALSHLRTDESTVKRIFSNNYKNITDKYNVNLALDGTEKEDNTKGLINKIKIKFTNKKDNESKIIEFVFTGFKITKKVPDKEDKNSKKNYIKKKEKIDSKITALYPSLVAYMMMYTQDSKNYKDLIQKNNAINFEELKNYNSDLFSSPEINLNVIALKDLLLEYNRDLGKLYKDKVIAVSYDDINGKLGVKILIENIDENNTISNHHSETLEFTFYGFRKIDLNHPDKNVLSLLLPQNNFKDMIQDRVLKKKVEELKSGKQKENKILINDEYLKRLIFKNLLVQITDNEYNVYRSTQTLSLQFNSKKGNYTSILGLSGNGSLYPFHTIINNDSIKNVYLTINKEDKKYKVEIDFEVNIPIFSSTTSDLTSHATSGDTKILKLQIAANTLID
ncbi:Hypothetical protein, predicted lipoprotein [Mycoplasma mycoides subsp. capri LC str. 95010]|uniref:LppA family lipoprotein n=1 Tax=Mycoplasma mycoides subsp. capri LC str. 95010 TaxID=862259 RepID=F4MNR0_MYCML|nr:LppA family lipoprotein [Mycoplasma mycoides]CBW53742.1 Hypothetical protein, predicted lipoprotein [Mycoplasma mycoides subsp. capri LC str. 95010]